METCLRCGVSLYLPSPDDSVLWRNVEDNDPRCSGEDRFHEAEGGLRDGG